MQAKPGLEVELISGLSSGREGSLESVFSNQPRTLSLLPELVRPVHPVKDFQAWRRLTACFGAHPPDIVHTHSGKAGVLGRLAAARAGVAVIVHTIHGPSFGAFQGALPNLIFRAAERYAARVTTHFVVVADAMKQQYLAAGIGEPSQYTRVFSGFDLKPFLEARNDVAHRARLGLGPEDVVVGKIARLWKLKGHEDLLAIAGPLIAACPRVKLLLIGDGPWRERFETRVRESGLERHVVFTGLVPPAEVPGLVGLIDILVHASLREGLARALPQALAAGKPVVAYDCDGASEVCREGETGFLVRPGDRETLKSRLIELAREPELRRRLGSVGREFVRGRFSAQRMVDDLYELYLRLAQRSRAARGSEPRC